MNIENHLNKITAIVGQPLELIHKIEEAKSNLHIIKTLTVLKELNLALEELANDHYFPFMEIDTFTGRDNTQDFRITIVFRGKDNQNPTEQFIRDTRMLRTKMTEAVNDKEGMLIKFMPIMDNKTKASIALSYNNEENNDTLTKSFLTIEQLCKIDFLLLNDELPTQTTNNRKIKL